MKITTLIFTLAVASLAACAQVEYRNYDDFYPDVHRNCSSNFDEVIDEVSTVKNVLVRNKEVVNYYHDNVVVENHYNIRYNPMGRSTYLNRTPMYRSANKRIIVPRRATESSYAQVNQSNYVCLENTGDFKWFFFFQLNSDYLTNKEELGHLINYAKTNPYSVFYIDAYADAGTGGYDTNMRISQMRANTITNSLIREGIESKRLFVQCHGSTSQPYNQNNLNRCVTVVAKR